MAMNRPMTCGCLSLLTAASLIAGICGDAFAVDRRFELDPRLLEQKRSPAPAAPQRPPVPGRPLPRKELRAKKGGAPARQVASPGTAPGQLPGGKLSLLRISPAAAAAELKTVRALWERLVPAPPSEGPLEIGSDSFSLTLDPKLYQVMPAADGGRIIIDANRTIPPLVRTLIAEKDPGLRIVSEAPADGKRFYTQLLRSAGFYSVEPDFTMHFGDDPRLSVRADFRLERTPDSLLRNEAVLLYTGAGRYALPPSLQGYLGSAGFQVVEPDLPQHDTPAGRNAFVQASAGSRFQVADTVLGALGVETESGKSVEFSGWLSRGISLRVRPDRFFTYRGRAYAVTVYDGNPASYTLTRLLETQGVTVVLLGEKDDFRAVTAKLLAALKLPARYDLHRLWPLRETPYSVQMSGFLLSEPESGRTLFLTDREVSPLVLDLISRNGYAVTGGEP